ncbi:MAG TPA: peptidylprolyl isomerase [Steroidobacteraceae bacterium]|jgi:peptidyl-prolyl cis-trans isomerase SurA|nr:peptidylprolyl isomerase [Steroidobacteraceae bacterium]
MPLIFKQFFGALALLAAAAGSAHAQSKELSSTGVLLDRVAAVVNDGIVLRSDVETQMQTIGDRIQQQGQQLPPRNVLRQQVLERLVLQELQMQRAERLGIKIADEAVNQALTEVAQRNNIKFSELPAALEAQGLDYRDYRDEVRREMVMQTLRQRDVLARVYVSPREVEQCIAKRKASPNVDNEFNLAHILVAVPSTADEQQIAERTSRAQAVYARAKQNEDFGQLAITYSDSGTALEGGALGWRKASQLPSFVAEIIPTLQPGGVTEPIRTPSGLHIFKVLEVRGGQAPAMVSQVHARHILMKPNEVEDDQTVRQKLTQIRERVLKGESFEAIASVTSEDPGSAAEGGDLGWAGRGSFVPEFERQLDALQENQISEPFKTEYGWHIIQLLGRRTYDASGDVTRNRCVVQLREARADEETEIWLRRLRDEAFVEYRM